MSFYNVNATFLTSVPHSPVPASEQTFLRLLHGTNFLTQIQDVHVTEVERTPPTPKKQQLVLQQSSWMSEQRSKWTKHLQQVPKTDTSPLVLLSGRHSFSLHLALPPATAAQRQNPIRIPDRRYSQSHCPKYSPILRRNGGKQSPSI